MKYWQHAASSLIPMRSQFSVTHLVQKKVIWKNHFHGGPEIDWFEAIFGFLMKFWFWKWGPALRRWHWMFSRPPGRSEKLLGKKEGSNLFPVSRLVQRKYKFEYQAWKKTLPWLEIRNHSCLDSENLLICKIIQGKIYGSLLQTGELFFQKIADFYQVILNSHYSWNRCIRSTM